MMQVDLTGINILIVEDEEMLLELMQEEFEAVGASVTTCGTGCDALEKFQQGSFHVIITDIRMPDGTGTWLVEEVCKITENPPVIFLCSGIEFENEMIECPNVRKIFRKPVKISEIIRETAKTFF